MAGQTRGFCPECGARKTSGANFCANCGYAFDLSYTRPRGGWVQPQNSSGPTTGGAVRQGFGWFFGWSLGCLVLGVLGLVVLLLLVSASLNAVHG